MLVVRYLRILAERKVLQFAYTESNEFHMHCRFISLQTSSRYLCSLVFAPADCFLILLILFNLFILLKININAAKYVA